ncbi:MAG: succinate dehydrogenase/fumarate reductase iron-sulfur subunit [Elusimicrobia bacterium]|nr:succinate dehydrogenase/fumarate reductase iron-sulfur subunit [Elusimicrobiota bacterium]
MEKGFNITLRVWKKSQDEKDGRFETYKLENVIPDMSFLEMLDVLNEKLLKEGKEPIAVESDCREGICGCCGLVINGDVHGPDEHSTVCQLHMRRFKDGDIITIEPFKASPFPPIKDLVIDRSALDKIISAGGYVSVNAGSAPEANSIPVNKSLAEKAMDAAACIGCGACVAACPNSAAMLFTGAKISQLAILPQGNPERTSRVLNMVKAMDFLGFGNCSNEYECEAVCPKEIKISNIARMNREFLRANFICEEDPEMPLVFHKSTVDIPEEE